MQIRLHFLTFYKDINNVINIHPGEKIMYEAILMMGGLGLGIGICLAVASKVFYVYVDPIIEAVEGVLPGANCGGCGFPGCSANAQAIVAGKTTAGSCVAGGSEIGEAIAKI